CRTVSSPLISRSWAPSGSFSSSETTIVPFGRCTTPVAWLTQANNRKMYGTVAILSTMTIEFRDESVGRLRGLSATAPGGAVIGVIGESGCGASDLLALATAKG